MDKRGQTAIELFLVLALVFAIIAALVPLIGKQNELNLITAAARNGATEAAALFSLGFSTNVIQEVIRLEKIGEEHDDNKMEVKLSITFSSKVDENFVKSLVLKHIYKALFGDFPLTEISSVQGRYYKIDSAGIIVYPT